MSLSLSKITALLHTVTAASGLGVIADAVTAMHGAAQTGGVAAGLAALVAAAVSLASHSRKVAEFEHTVEMDASKLVTPGVVADVHAVEARVADVEAKAAKIVPVEDINRAVADTAARVKADVLAALPAPAKPAVEDVEHAVEQVLASKFGQPAQPAAPAAPAAPAVAEAPAGQPPAAA